MPQEELIGITGPSRFTSECRSLVEDFMKSNYVDLTQSKFVNVEKHLSRCSGVILAGGIDIHPSIYGNNYVEKSSFKKQAMNVLGGITYSEFSLQRDTMELQIIEYCMANNIPMFGICRGHQLLGVMHGQDFLPEVNDDEVCHNPSRLGHKENKSTYHTINIRNPNIRVPFAVERKEIYRIMKQKLNTRFLVNSFHHQGLNWDSKKLDAIYEKEGVVVDGVVRNNVANDSWIIEMMHSSDPSNNWLSVQFHPELDYEENTYSKYVVTIFDVMVKNKISFNEALVNIYSKNLFTFTEKNAPVKP